MLFFSLWASLTWGVWYGLTQSIPIMFRQLYNFSDGQVGLVFSSLL